MESRSEMIQQQKRNSAIELCRILSMLMIIGHHFSDHGGFEYDNLMISIPRLWWHVIEMGGGFGVDVFIIISGYFLINTTDLKINVKKTSKLWGQVFFYSICFFFLGVILGIEYFSIVQLIKSFFPITTRQWWFATTYFVLFLIHPFLNKLLLNLEKRQYQQLLGLLFLIWCIIPTFTSFPLSSNEFCQFLLIYSIGGYIKLYGNRTRFKSRNYLHFWLITTIITYASSVAFMILGEKIPALQNYSTYFYGRLSLPTLLRAICFFMIFERMTIPQNKYINHISATTFGVYLIHEHYIIRPLLWKKVFINAQFQDSLMLIPYSVIVSIIVYIACILIDLIRIKTVEVLFMKVVTKYANKILVPCKQICRYVANCLFGKD